MQLKMALGNNTTAAKISQVKLHSKRLSRYLPGSKTPPQNSAEAKKLGGDRAD